MIAYIQGQMARTSDAGTSSGHFQNIGMSYSLLPNAFPISNPWILDSGATSHIVQSLDLFSDYQFLTNKFVSLPNNSKVSVTAIGTICLNKHLMFCIFMIFKSI
jgi:hypothetical protein